MIQKPRGTRDFRSDEMEKRRYLEKLMREEAALFGFREIATPIFENTELFTLKSGPNVIDEIYAFTDKGGREIALRPELTAPAMRFFVNELSSEPRPLKMFYFGQCFRYERPQSGRYREFFQFGAEMIGSAGPQSDAEVISLAASIMKHIGLKDYRIRIGHIGVLREMLSSSGASAENIPLILQKLDKKEYEEASQRMEAAGLSKDSISTIIDVTETVGSIDVLEKIKGDAREHLSKVFQILNYYGFDNVEIDLGVVRGLDYYTGLVFEMDAPVLGAEKQICGGGSYSLTELFGGEKTFSTGFGIGFDRTLLALEREGFETPKYEISAYVIPVSDTMKDECYKIAADLRLSNIPTELDLIGRSLSKNFKYASSINAKKAVIVGEKEFAEGCVSIRDMLSGEQKVVKIAEILQEF